ncbi:MAG: hypothetical protein ACKOA8_09840, partial [Deltaproteobacteria bacterium]
CPAGRRVVSFESSEVMKVARQDIRPAAGHRDRHLSKRLFFAVRSRPSADAVAKTSLPDSQ